MTDVPNNEDKDDLSFLSKALDDAITAQEDYDPFAADDAGGAYAPVDAKQEDTNETATEEQVDDGQSGQGDQQRSEQDTANTEQQSQDAEGKPKDGKESKGPKDLTLDDGTVIKGGTERRLYEKTQKLEREREAERQQFQQFATQAQQQFQQLQAQVRAYEQANHTQQQLGLQPDESSMAMKLLANYKQDPIGTLKYMLSEAKAAGHNLEALEGAGGSIDTAAISRMIDQRLAPLTQEREQRTQQQRAVSEAQRQVQQFVSQRPDAQHHVGLMAKLINENPGLSLSDAYYELRIAAERRGLDFNRPLEPQLAEAQRMQPQTQQHRETLPHGRNMTGQAVVPNKSRSNPLDDWDAIVSDVLRGS